MPNNQLPINEELLIGQRGLPFRELPELRDYFAERTKNEIRDGETKDAGRALKRVGLRIVWFVMGFIIGAATIGTWQSQQNGGFWMGYVSGMGSLLALLILIWCIPKIPKVLIYCWHAARPHILK